MAYFINSLYCNFHAMNDIDIFINKTHKKMKFKKHNWQTKFEKKCMKF